MTLTYMELDFFFRESTINVVEIDSSDDEDGFRAPNRNNTSSNQPPLPSLPNIQRTTTIPPSEPSYQTLELRSFWKAGAYEIGPTKSAPSQGQLEHARVHPKFLHSNATSHKWAFGAIAELLDNAVDEHGGSEVVVA
ncbi:unnamed protein product [Ilex paraguariensis]|uniref:Uncharacterized protein n=1 Tax=Ilex paraguariensis TaxID=185542 RepID=A0ABC8SIR8_9AQUA